jgi:hypothetical protein
LIIDVLNVAVQLRTLNAKKGTSSCTNNDNIIMSKSCNIKRYNKIRQDKTRQDTAIPVHGKGKAVPVLN